MSFILQNTKNATGEFLVARRARGQRARRPLGRVIRMVATVPPPLDQARPEPVQEWCLDEGARASWCILVGIVGWENYISWLRDGIFGIGFFLFAWHDVLLLLVVVLLLSAGKFVLLG